MKWIKLILLCFMVFIIGCRKFDEMPIPPPAQPNIFSVKEASISNEDPINFNLNSEGIYTLTLFDSVAQQVVTRERIVGRVGNNSLKLYTKSLQSKYLYLSLEDESGKEIGKTLLLIK